MSKEVFRLGELFCGPGGIACGAHNAVSDDGEKRLSMRGQMISIPIHAKHMQRISVMVMLLQFTAVMSMNWIFQHSGQ